MGYPGLSNSGLRALLGQTNKKERIPLKHGTRTGLLADAAKCQRCGKSLRGMRPHIHHKNQNPSDNRKENLILLCPNCHSKLHRAAEGKKKTRRPQSSSGLSFTLPKPMKLRF